MRLLLLSLATPPQTTTTGGHSSGIQQVASLFGIIGGAIALVGVTAIALFYFRSSYSKATIDSLKENNQALTERVGLVEAEAERCTTRCTALEQENSTLRALVTGRSAIEALELTLRDVHHEAMSMDTTTQELITDVLAEIKKVHTVVIRKGAT